MYKKGTLYKQRNQQNRCTALNVETGALIYHKHMSISTCGLVSETYLCKTYDNIFRLDLMYGHF